MITDHVHGSPHIANRGFEACRARPISNDKKRNTTAAVSADRSRGRRRLLEKGRTEFCCSTQTQEACNEKYDDHDADDVENIHCVLRSRLVRLQYETTALQSKTYRHASKFQILFRPRGRPRGFNFCARHDENGEVGVSDLGGAIKCPLSRVKQTSLSQRKMSANDPKRTLKL